MDSENRNRALSGLRGIAVLYVLCSHIGTGLFPFPHDAIGKVGVWIFFCLSAFLLTSRLSGSARIEGRGPAVCKYLVHRVFRIFPLFVVVLLIHFGLGALSAESVLRHLLLVEGWRELWAIPVEFQYYLLIPLSALLPRAWATALLLLLLAGSFLSGVLHPMSVFANSVVLLPKAVPFLLASLLAIWSGTIGLRAWTGWLCVLLLLACTVVYRHMHVANEWFGISPLLSLAIGVAAVGIIACVQGKGVLTSALSARPLVFLGDISFSVYLLHMIVLNFVGALGWPAPATAWSVVLVTVLVSYVSYRVIERPGIRAGRYLAGRVGRLADRIFLTRPAG